MYCTRCGSAANRKRFCTQCGFELKQVPPRTAHAGSSGGSGLPEKTPDEIQQNQAGDALIGRTIDQRYTLESRLGFGGMGAVYRAERLHIGDKVAVKILNPDFVADPIAVERFHREAQIGARLRHPNAVTVYDFGVSEDGLIYIVMELVEGNDLRSVIMQTGQMSQALAAGILVQVCAALDEAHNQNVVHRDLKPENILVQYTPTEQRVKVLDFGIASIRNLTDNKLTQTGRTVGTPHYMSPEQCMGEEVDGRSDIYSLGIILYEMLAGTVPFNSTTPTAIAVQQVKETPPSLRALNPNVSPLVEAVVMRALEKRPEARPQSASALARELLAAVNGKQPTLIGQNAIFERAPEMSPSSAMHGAVKSKAFVMATIGLVLLFAVATGSGLSWRSKNDGNRQQSAASVVTNNDPATAPSPPTNLDPGEPGEKPEPKIETRPSPRSGNQLVRRNDRARQNGIDKNRRVFLKKVVVPDMRDYGSMRDRQKMFEDDDGYRFRRGRRMMFENDESYRNRFDSVTTYYRDGLCKRRRYGRDYR